MAVLLHPAAQLSWTSFTVHASTVVGLAALGGLYAWAARREHGGESAAGLSPLAVRPTAGQRVAFFLGLALLFLTLNGPLHDLSDYYLFSAHMVQHLVLTLIVPPLLVAGTPGGMLRPLLAVRPIGAIARRITTPIACFAIFNIVLAAWHLPPLYNTAMAHHPVHIIQHLMFIAASVLLWWPLLSPLPELPRLSYPGQMLYCFLLVIPMSIISIYIAMADHVLYPAYSIAPRILSITPMEDQQYGGLIMWIPGGLFFYGVMSVVFFKWVGRGQDDTAGAQVDWKPTTVSSR
jgi:putative membrane protein